MDPSFFWTEYERYIEHNPPIKIADTEIPTIVIGIVKIRPSFPVATMSPYLLWNIQTEHEEFFIFEVSNLS